MLSLNTDETKQTSFIIGPKRKRSSFSDQVYDSHQSTPPPTSSTNAAENHLPIGASQEHEMPVRKKRRTESFEKLLSLKSVKWSCGSEQAMIYERQVEDHISLQSIAWSVEDPLEEPLSSDLEDLPPVDQQVQSPPAPVHHSPVGPASAHNSIVDLTTEDDILSRYEIGKMLGEGGFGCVYEGKRLEDGLEVAVKIASKPKNMKYIYVPGHPAPLPLEVGLLLLVNKEPRAPEIIQLLDWQDQPERYIMVMERPSPCKDLWDYVMLQGGFLSEDIARFIMAQTTKAAHTCCQRGVFHRDIKLENLLINPETLEVKLIDFGCGDLLQDSGYERFCGTPEYCPPEYYVDHKYHGKPTTVWSLGVLLFILVCGHYPEPRDIELIDYSAWFEPDLSNDKTECSHLIRSLLNESPSQRIDLGEILLHDWFKITKPTWRKM
ncbi:serine/threonine-protein kinase pim-2-like isoform X1 [Onychostoma macrolepis]|uniref:serine/threonine-protein kinase pim-2-like isoform X1 n=1 Tax=Onychostoma macrolepis TaxID=369639 RepID=UPI00272B5D7E|nr:serine/threonine-protein kinase pim-2-like isoform X1 [Onychostoma macrolepis]XP_058638130.1 serine/threonine-protein kinase pim-2-like isoform X1 [Onychostoma macrolepis]